MFKTVQQCWHTGMDDLVKQPWRFSFFFSFKRVLFQISITFILWEIMQSMCAEFRRAANLTMSLLIKQEVDNYADASNCSWYRVSFRIFIALDLRELHILLLTDSSAWEVIDGVKRLLCSRSIGAKAANQINLWGERSFWFKGFYLLVTWFISSKFFTLHIATVANRTLQRWAQIITVTSCVSITFTSLQ